MSSRPLKPNMISAQLSGIANLALLADIEPGFVPDAFDNFTYVTRLDQLLRTFNAIRKGSRESSKFRSPFPDYLGRFGILRTFRYAIVPPDLGTDRATHVGGPKGTYKLSLNVTFDGGWEPYMRVIQRDLGPLLDAILCHCTGYKLADEMSFDDYMRWVRNHEIPDGLYYADSARTTKDVRYLEAFEAGARGHADDLAGLHVAPYPPVASAPELFAAASRGAQLETVEVYLKALKALYDLKRLYWSPRDEKILRRLAQESLKEFHQVLKSPAAKAPGVAGVLAAAKPLIDWLNDPLDPGPRVGRPAAPVAANFQAGILERYDSVTEGRLVLMRITAPADAARSLVGLSVSVRGAAARDVECNVAFTLAGLRTLGLPPERVDLFPQEFLEGMEARAGLLGDVRGNHPKHWKRPLLDGRKVEIDLVAVDVVIQLRTRAGKDGRAKDLHRLDAAVTDLRQLPGLAVLAAEPMRSFPVSPEATREHFGFEDGFSQPVIDDAAVPVPSTTPFDDRVRRGEIFLGHDDDRGRSVFPSVQDDVIDNGTFLVIRKTRQFVENLDEVLDAAIDEGLTGKARVEAKTALKSLMMGRSTAGRSPMHLPGMPPTQNGFDYASDSQGRQCPLQSHVRRANPRDEPKLPRIIRRGMSYGDPDGPGVPPQPRGLYFMAYCAGLSEQFETLQRWISGANSSGVLSSYGDAYLGVPVAEHDRIFQYSDGQRDIRVNLGRKPITELQWGMYLFVPSMEGLEKLLTLASIKPAVPVLHGSWPHTGEEWQHALEDARYSKNAWAAVRAAGGDIATHYGRLVSDPVKLRDILADAAGTQHSVCGYGRRLTSSVGIGYLGLDGTDHDAIAEGPTWQTGVNQMIADVKQPEAFDLALKVTRGALDHAIELSRRPLPDGRLATPIDLAWMCEDVLAALCTHWFGLPEATPRLMLPGGRTVGGTGAPPRCPRNFQSVSRHVFAPHPSKTVSAEAQPFGHDVLAAVSSFLAVKPDPTTAPLTAKIVDAMKAAKHDDDTIAKTVAGTMLGFPPTVHGNFVRVMKAWLQTRPDEDSPEPVTSVWDLQAALLTVPGEASAVTYDIAFKALFKPLIDQMKRGPVPEMIWREAPRAGHGFGGEPEKTVLGLIGAMQYDGADPMLMFGGTREPAATSHAMHACPGYDMAIGVLLGMIAAILTQGTLRGTPSPLTVEIVN